MSNFVFKFANKLIWWMNEQIINYLMHMYLKKAIKKEL